MMNHHRSIFGYVLSLGLWGLVLCWMPVVLAENRLEPPTLTGSVSQQQTQAGTAGWIVDERTGQTLPGTLVEIPAWGYQSVSGSAGQFVLPRIPEQPVIARVRAVGYQTRTITLGLQGAASDKPLVIGLRAIQTRTERTLVLDDQLHHLGDNSYAPNSSGAGRFRQLAQGPGLVKDFLLPALPNGPMVFLGIGSVIGLDTIAAKRTGQSLFYRYSSPMEVILNGTPVGQVHLNGDGQRLAIPAGLFRPMSANRLEIRTGYQIPDGTYIDYDDMELMLLTLTF